MKPNMTSKNTSSALYKKQKQQIRGLLHAHRSGCAWVMLNVDSQQSCNSAASVIDKYKRLRDTQTIAGDEFSVPLKSANRQRDLAISLLNGVSYFDPVGCTNSEIVIFFEGVAHALSNCSAFFASSLQFLERIWMSEDGIVVRLSEEEQETAMPSQRH